MKKVSRRALALLFTIILLGCGTLVFCVNFFISGGKWAASRISYGVWSSGSPERGTVLDRAGITLSGVADGKRFYAEDENTRRATLHVVGDTGGNIGTSALSAFAARLIGWNPITGIHGLQNFGGTVKLSVSAKISRAALSALGNKNGAVVVIDYTSGEILCAVSTPAFDPENPPSDISSKYEGVYINRALSAAYTPGSTFKIVTAAAAIENIHDIHERVFHCAGSYGIGDGFVTCPSKHGDLTFRDAFTHSCNITFAQLAIELGADLLEKYASDYGLVGRLSADGVVTATGRFDKAETGLDLAWSGVGQYNNLASPVAMARLSAAVANGGKAASLHLLSGQILNASSRVLKSETAAVLFDMMKYNVTSYYGSANFAGFDVGAKSGTAEVGAGEPHAWFTGFIDDENYPYAFAVIAENSGSGRIVAGGIISELLRVISG